MDPALRSYSPEEKRALLAEVLRRRAAQPVRAPLSPGQERLWRLLELEPDSPVYNLGFAYFLNGPLDVGALGRAIGAMARRHEALRTAFAVIGGVPMQEIASEEEVRLERMDLSAIAEAEFPLASRRIAEEAARARIDLSRAPLWRFVLLERSDSERVLLILTHHIISDRWSVGVLVQGLGAEYAALVRGEATTAGPAVSYREAIRQHEGVPEGPGRDDPLAYWRELFREGAPDLILPDVAPTAGEAGYRGTRRTFELSHELAARLRLSAADLGTTAYVILVAALAAHLHAATGQTDLVFAAPVSGRHRAATRGVIGYFNNILPIRLAIAPEAAFHDLVRTVSAAVKGAFDHQDVPFHQIAGLPALNRTRLARCLVSLQNTTAMDLVLPGVASHYEDLPTGTANFDLAVMLEEQGPRYRGWVDAKAGLWSPAALEGFLGGFLSTLEAMTGDPDRRLAGPAAGTPADLPSPPAATGGPGPADRARNELERRMIAIWEDAMGLRPLAPHSHFFELGGHSLLAARIFDRIAQAIGREVPLAALLRAPTIRQLTDLIVRDGDAPCWAALVPVQPHGHRPPLFCVHGGGGGVLSYTRVAAHLGADRPLWGLQAPNRPEGASPPRVEEMAADYLRAIVAAEPEGPYHLCGHSFGGLVAFEIARQLAEQGRTTGVLVIIDYPGPDARITLLDRFRWFLYSLGQLAPGQRLPYILDRLRYRIRRNPRCYRALTSIGGLLKLGMDSRKTEYRLKTMNATMTAMGQYRPGPYPGRLTLFRARGGDAAINSDPRGGWGRTALGGVEVHDFACDHMEVLEEPHVRAVASALRDCLARAATPPAVPVEAEAAR